MSTPETVPAPADSSHEQAEIPPTSPHMEQTVSQLAQAYGVDLTQAGGSFQVGRPGFTQCWLIANIDGTRIGITRCQVDKDECLAPDLDIVFEITSAGWEPIEIIHAPTVWSDYINTAQAKEGTLIDPQDDFSFGAFAGFVARQIEEDGRLAQMPSGENRPVQALRGQAEMIFLYDQEGENR